LARAAKPVNGSPVFGPPYAAVVLAVDITKIEVLVEPEPVHWTRDTLPAAVHRRLR